MRFAQVLRREQNLARHHAFLGKSSAAPAAACGVGQTLPLHGRPSCLPSHCLETYDASLGKRLRLRKFRKNA
ncbi:MAG: hypothetical protein HYT98_05285 [Candidatus Sungbacteria bacterium]|nr:hypothetical protein [Candidatus Sungbacteria bacterium]